MFRLLLCLPLCLLLAPNYPLAPLAAVESGTQEVGATSDKSLPDPASDPLGFLEACLKRYDQKVNSYSLVFRKQERIDGKLNPLEIVLVHYKDAPHSVYFHWEQPPNRLVRRALYVEGENKNAQGASL